MWGNSTGWMISALIAVLFAVVLYSYSQLDVPDPTPKFLSILAPIELPIPPGQLVAMDQDCDSGDAYRDAINEYKKNPAVYDSDTTPSTPLPAVQDLLKATHCKNITLFSKDPSEIINYSDHQPPLEALQSVGNMTINQGLALKNDNKPAEAEKYFEAAFALGAKMFAERVTYSELEAGEGLMSGGVSGMIKLADSAHDDARSQLCRDFQFKYSQFDRDHIKQVLQLVATIDARVESREAGDDFYLAEKKSNKVDHMWQIEAIRVLGRFRFEDVGVGPQQLANIVLRRLAKNNKDPQVQAATKIALELTKETFPLIGG